MRTSILALAALATLACGTARANQTATQTQSFNAASGTFSSSSAIIAPDVLSFAGFDSTLGTLTGVNITLTSITQAGRARSRPICSAARPRSRSTWTSPMPAATRC